MLSELWSNMQSDLPAYALATVSALLVIFYHSMFRGTVSWTPLLIFIAIWLFIVFGLYPMLYETSLKPFYE